MRVAYLDFIGDVQLGIAKAAPSAATPPPAPPAEPVVDPMANDQATGGFPLQQEDKDTPMVGPLATAVALLAIALVLRRRLA